MSETSKFGKKEIWKVFWFLLVVTIIEFVIAFGMSKGIFKNFLFVILTFVKAYGIMAFFMHLKFEFSNLKATIIIPFSFIVLLLIVLAYEGVTINLWSFLK